MHTRLFAIAACLSALPWGVGAQSTETSMFAAIYADLRDELPAGVHAVAEDDALFRPAASSFQSSEDVARQRNRAFAVHHGLPSGQLSEFLRCPDGGMSCHLVGDVVATLSFEVESATRTQATVFAIVRTQGPRDAVMPVHLVAYQVRLTKAGEDWRVAARSIRAQS